MNRGNFFRRTLLTLFTVSIMLFATVVGAAIQIFDGYGECEMGEFTTLPKAKERALERAKLDAQKQAGLYLKTESRSINSELVDDAISAVTNNIINISDVQYETVTQKITERTTAVVIVAKLKASIDPSGLYDFIKRDEKEKVTIIQQNDNLQDAIQKNDKEFEDLKEQYKCATSQAEKDKILKQMNDVDRDFLANQKLQEGNKLYYDKDYNGAIKLYDEALKFGNYVEIYYNRGTVYAKELQQYERAIQDFNKAIQLNPNYEDAYNNRGLTYDNLGQYERAIQDYNKAIQLNPKLTIAYNNRGWDYVLIKQYEKAIQDFNKAIELTPNYSYAYNNRGWVYYSLKKFELAIQDYSKVIQLNPNLYQAYSNRGKVYSSLKQYDKAIQDYTKAIQINPNDSLAYSLRGGVYGNLEQYERAIQDYDKALELNPNDDVTYSIRTLTYNLLGFYYEKHGEKVKAKAAFAKAKELGFNG